MIYWRCIQATPLWLAGSRNRLIICWNTSLSIMSVFMIIQRDTHAGSKMKRKMNTSMLLKFPCMFPLIIVWLANQFIPHLLPPRPVALLIENAEAHIDLHTFELAMNNIFIFALLRNATHLLQPPHVGLFGPWKQAWYMTVRRFT